MVKHNNQWGTVCDDFLLTAGENNGNNDQARALINAQSACHTLGLSGGSTEKYKYTGSEPFLMDDVDCASNTTNFLECSHRGWGTEDCGPSETVLLTCT